MMKSSLVAFLFVLPSLLYAQQAATIKETTQTYTTYPFSDPDPIPAVQKIYPYFRFDGFTQASVQKKWTVIELENDFIQVQIMPEIGGKIWSAFDKLTQKNFIYRNDVVKFRDIAMRGPWTSGGIEANYGIIGHTPNTSTPVDYLTQQREDGSVSCFISTLDLLTRTRWTLEVRLEKDKRYFSTRSFWSNTNVVEQPYYTWMNLGVPAGDDLQFLYPGDHYIGHDGQSHAWPIDAQGRNLSYYNQNNFGSSKSYHVLGTHSRYFSAYWKNEDYGMVRYANREDKLGKKIFLWAQSDQGKIWERLLTDHSGQYVEIQSGRLFNQNVFESSFTPFKQLRFKPYQSDRWTEYWFPYQGIGKAQAANLLGTFSSKQKGDTCILTIDPNQPLADSLWIYDHHDKLLKSTFVRADVGQPVHIKVVEAKGRAMQQIKIRNEVVDLAESKSAHSLQRPLTIAPNLDTGSAYGLYLQGRDLLRLRYYKEAVPKLVQSLAKDENFVPALIAMAKLQWFHMNYDSVFYYAKRALRVDTYHSEANYYYGLAAAQLGYSYDAMDGFEVASLDPDFQSAAYTALSKVYSIRHDYKQAYDYAQKALNKNGDNIEAWQLQYVHARLLHKKKDLETIARAISQLDPLNPFIRFEAYYHERTARAKDHFISLIRNEMPVETYLELAIWYANLKQFDAAKEILALSPQNAEVLYWLAWLWRDRPDEKNNWLTKADAADMKQVFPFREESVKVFAWAAQESKSWKPRYLEALIQTFRNNDHVARKLLNGITVQVNHAPFYVARARLYESGQAMKQQQDLEQAIRLDKAEWRYGQLLARLLAQQKKYAAAVAVLEPYYKRSPSNYMIGLDYIRMLMLQGSFSHAEKMLKAIQVLPFEGATDGRKYYEQTKLMLALQALQQKKYRLADQKIQEAQSWPDHLGVGEPYDELKDEQMIHWVKGQINKSQGKQAAFEQCMHAIIADQHTAIGTTALLKIAAYKALGQDTEAAAQAEKWMANKQNAALGDEVKQLWKQAQAEDQSFLLRDVITYSLQTQDKRLF